MRSSGGACSAVEDWNAQLSLMTGMAAAQLMVDARVGILRTMPAPDAARIAAFRTQTEALGRPWPEAVSYGEYLRGLDRTDPACLAIMRAAGGLFRGAGYEAFDGTCRATPCSRRSRRRTRTSPRRCADSSIGGVSSSARR